VCPRKDMTKFLISAVPLQSMNTKSNNSNNRILPVGGFDSRQRYGAQVLLQKYKV
jgi:hypothetical protein